MDKRIILTTAMAFGCAAAMTAGSNDAPVVATDAYRWQGDTIYQMVKEDRDVSTFIEQVKIMCSLLYKKGLNIDYFPTNFVVQNNEVFYIDYECNSYMDEWNFENWGIKYYSKTEEFLEYMNNHKDL